MWNYSNVIHHFCGCHGMEECCNIYTTIAALSAKICPHNLTNFYPDAPKSTATIPYICLRLHIANPRPLCDRLLRLSFVFYVSKSSKNHRCDESVSIGVIDLLRSANDDPNALLQINRYMATRVPALIQPVDPRVAAQRPTGCCSVTHGLLLSDPRVAAQ